MERSASFEARSARCLTRQLYEPPPHKLVTHRFAMNDMLKRVTLYFAKRPCALIVLNGALRKRDVQLKNFGIFYDVHLESLWDTCPAAAHALSASKSEGKGTLVLQGSQLVITKCP